MLGVRGVTTELTQPSRVDLHTRFISTTDIGSSRSSFTVSRLSKPSTSRHQSSAPAWRLGVRSKAAADKSLRPHGAQPASPEFSDGIASSRFLAGSQRQHAAAAALPAYEEELAAEPAFAGASSLMTGENIEGTVQKIQFRDAESGYTVFKLSVKPKDLEKEKTADTGSGQQASSPSRKSNKREKAEILTVVGNIPQVIVGQSIRITGTWTEHAQYGRQLKANDIEELRPSADGDLVAYLSGGVIPGVGPTIAQRIVDKYGTAVEDVLNSDDAAYKLTQCEKIGFRTAEKIKQGWDAGQAAREGSRFLREAGLPAALSQRIAQRYGPATKDVVSTDPYLALAPFKIPLTKIDAVATHVGASPELVSRAAAAITHTLKAASSQEGHSYLSWHVLEGRTRKLLAELGKQHGNTWPHLDQLHIVAQHMHNVGGAVIEPMTSNSTDGSSSAEELFVGETGESIGSVLTKPLSSSSTSFSNHPEFKDDSELRAYVAQRAPAASKTHLDAMLSTLGLAVLAVLDLPSKDAVAGLSQCPRIGIKTAQKIKDSWDLSRRTSSIGSNSNIGLRMSSLLENLPSLDFDWSPDVRCYSPQMHAAETTVATRIAEKAALFKAPNKSRLGRIRKWIDANQEGMTMELSAGQIAAIEAASDAPVLIVTGGPGCGKTTAVQTVVKLWCAQGKLVRICAPTGRAAQRMGIIQGIEPSTIHRMLKYAPRTSNNNSTNDASTASDETTDDNHLDGWGSFEYNSSNPLPAHAVLIDEASMLSLPLAAALIDSLQTKTQLVLIGDVDQLPPVGPGSVLQSLISSGMVPVIDLREIFRQAAESDIITSALEVRRGQPPDLATAAPTPQDLLNSTRDAVVVRAPSPEALPNMVHQVVDAMRRASGSSVDSDLQVISPMRKGEAGTSALNPALQALLNPPSPSKAEIVRPGYQPHPQSTNNNSSSSSHAGRVFRVGDRVLQTVNNYEKEVFNGDQGRIIAVSPGEKKITVEFPHLRKDGGGEGVEGMDCLRIYQGNELSELELAYAVTVHKAQGGESKHVVLALSCHHGRMLTRRLLYTALTRARERLVVVATGYPGGYDEDEDPLARAARRQEGEVRTSWLKERLAGEAKRLGVLSKEPAVFSNEAEVLGQHKLLTASPSATPTAAAGDVDEPSVHQLPVTVPAAVSERVDSGAEAVRRQIEAVEVEEAAAPRESEGEGPASQGDAYFAQNLEQLPVLCRILGLDQRTVEDMSRASFIRDAPLVDAPTLMSSVSKLKKAVKSSNDTIEEFLDLPELLRAVPRLLVSPPEYVDRGLAFCERLGPLDDGDTRNGEGQHESLVDQLRSLLGYIAQRQK